MVAVVKSWLAQIIMVVFFTTKKQGLVINCSTPVSVLPDCVLYLNPVFSSVNSDLDVWLC